jgi:hypothetical protein
MELKVGVVLIGVVERTGVTGVCNVVWNQEMKSSLVRDKISSSLRGLRDLNQWMNWMIFLASEMGMM